MNTRDINKYKRLTSFYLRNRVSKKIVVIESDDWGLERAIDATSLSKIVEKYGKSNISRWTTDAIESVEDLELIYNLFATYQNSFLKAPQLTANFITHNIDYSSKNNLKFKPISEGYNFADKALFLKYKEGIEKGFFKPQLHGFSHYNTELLKNSFNSFDFQEDLEFGFPLAKTTINKNLRLYRGECFDTNFELNLKKAQEVFFKTFGYQSQTFIPPNYQFATKCVPVLIENNICLLQASNHFLNEEGKGNVAPLFRKKAGIYYATRNARIDVHPSYNFTAIQCIEAIATAFKNKMPAIIDMHRVNFSGTYTPEYRKMALEELEKVIYFLVKNHPEVLFLASDELIPYIC